MANKQEKFWSIFDKDGILVLLFSVPLALFLLIGYFKESLVNITMPIFLYWSSIIFTLTAIHAIKRQVFQYFSRGPVLYGKHPIWFWVLVTVWFFLAILFFSIATIYVTDNVVVHLKT